MTINYSPLLQLAEPVTGTESGVWGDVVNQQITLLTEAAIAGASTITFTSSDVTLTTTTGSGGNQSRSAILLLAGSPASAYNLVGPGTSKIYLVRNATGQTITFKASGTTGIALATGTTSWVFWNGSDYALAAPTITTSTGTVPIASGVGGLGSGVATFLATPSSANLAAALTDETGTGANVFATAPSLSNPTITNYTETDYTATVTGNAITLAIANGTYQTITTMAGANAITLPAVSGLAGKSMTVQIVYASTPTSLSWAVASSGTLKFPSGTTPTATLTNGKYDFYTFICDGTYWYGIQSGANF